MSALIQIRFDVSIYDLMLILLSSWLRVNINSRAFSSANEVDKVLSSANSIDSHKDGEFGRSFINNKNNNGSRTYPCGTPLLIEEEEEVTPLITVIWFLSLRYDLSHSCETPLIPYKFNFDNKMLWSTVSSAFGKGNG